MNTLTQLHDAYVNDQNPTTKNLLNDLFKENTTKHMLDSGGAYGRNREKNEELDDLEEDKEGLSIRLSDRSGDDGKGTVEILPTGSVFHMLLEHAELSDNALELNHDFKEFEKNDESNDSWLSLMEKFVGREDRNAHAFNTYNDEFTNYDQCIQFIPFTLKGGKPYYDIYGEFVLIQIHGGCDIRGGYTAPVVLECREAAYLTRGYSDLQIQSEATQLDLIEHEVYEVELYEHDLRAVPRDLSDDVDDSDDVDFIVDIEGNPVSYYSGPAKFKTGESVDPENFKDELWKYEHPKENEKTLNKV